MEKKKPNITKKHTPTTVDPHQIFKDLPYNEENINLIIEQLKANPKFYENQQIMPEWVYTKAAFIIKMIDEMDVVFIPKYFAKLLGNDEFCTSFRELLTNKPNKLRSIPDRLHEMGDDAFQKLCNICFDISRKDPVIYVPFLRGNMLVANEGVEFLKSLDEAKLDAVLLKISELNKAKFDYLRSHKNTKEFVGPLAERIERNERESVQQRKREVMRNALKQFQEDLEGLKQSHSREFRSEVGSVLKNFMTQTTGDCSDNIGKILYIAFCMAFADDDRRNHGLAVLERLGFDVDAIDAQVSPCFTNNQEPGNPYTTAYKGTSDHPVIEDAKKYLTAIGVADFFDLISDNKNPQSFQVKLENEERKSSDLQK